MEGEGETTLVDSEVAALTRAGGQRYRDEAYGQHHRYDVAHHAWSPLFDERFLGNAVM